MNTKKYRAYLSKKKRNKGNISSLRMKNTTDVSI